MLKQHQITADDIHRARREVCEMEHTLAMGEALGGGVKRLSYNCASGTYRIKTQSTERTCKFADEAALYYSEK